MARRGLAVKTNYNYEDKKDPTDVPLFSSDKWDEMEGFIFSFRNVTMGLAVLLILLWVGLLVGTFVVKT